MLTDLLLIAVFLLFSILLLSKSFQYMVIFLSFFIPFEEFVLKFMPVSDELYSLLRYGSELLLFLTFIALVFKKITEKKPFVRTAVDVPVFIFATVVFLSGLLNQIPFLEIILFIRIVLRYYILYFVVVNLELDREFSKKLIKGLIIIVLIQFVLGFAQVLIGSPLNKILLPRPSTLTVGSYSKEWLLLRGLRENGYLAFGTFGDPVNLGLFIFAIFVSILGTRFVWRKPIKKLWLFFIASFLTLLFTYSVGLIFALFVGLLFITIIKRKWTLVLSSSIIVLSFFLILTFFPADFAEVVTSNSAISPLRNLSATFSTTFLESIQENRLFTLTEVPKVILTQSPILGFGPGWNLIKDRISNYWLGDVYWAMILAEGGLIGLFAFIWIFWRLYKTALGVYQNSTDWLKKGISLGFLGVIVGVLFYNFIGPALETRPLAFYFWLFAGLIGNWSRSTI
ncbi:MAG TPA: hypothetical protein VMT04_10685 [Terriglobales bacterium]|nr:hypothetical protein [Terriglobales bacterium]